MFSTYILWSAGLRRFYVGSTNDLADRLARHNSGRSQATRLGVPWLLVHEETFQTRSEAVARERQIKNWKSAASIRRLVGEHPDL